MLDTQYYLYARFKGNDKTGYYTNNKNYLLEVRIGTFNKRVKIVNVHGHDSKPIVASALRYGTKEAFEASWKVIRDVSKDVRAQ